MRLMYLFFRQLLPLGCRSRQNYFPVVCLPFLLLFTAGNANAQNANYAWAKSIGGTSTDYGNDIAVDATGNVYVTGYFNGTAYINHGTGTDTLSSAGGYDVFVVKYDSNGNYLWAKSIGGTGTDYGYGIAVDGTGNVYVTGYFTTAAYINHGTGTDTLSSAGGGDAFVAKYDSNGNYLWAKSIGGTSTDYGYGVAVDGTGNVYVTGYFNTAAHINHSTGIDTLSSAGGNDVFVAKFDAIGNYLWAKSIGGTGADVGYGITTDATGNVSVTGYFNSATAYIHHGTGTDSFTSAGGYDVFVSKFDANGNYLWAKSMGGASTDYSYGVAADATGNVYITGRFNSTAADFDPGLDTATLTPVSGYDVFVAKYDVNGNYLWAKSMGGASTDYGWGIAADATGNVYVTGYFNSTTADFDPGAGIATLTSAGGYDAFVARYDPNGNYVWAVNVGGSSAEYGYGIAIDANDNVYATGRFNSTAADFDPGSGTDTLTTAGGYDAYVLKLSQGCQTYITLDQSACSSYTFNNTTYTSSGTYTATFTNAAGCDSVVTLNLTINNNSSSVNHAACDSYIFNNTTYTSSGTYTATFTNAAGCDSVVTLSLTINRSVDNPVVTGTYCDSVTFNGKTYTTSGNYVQEYKTTAGCDSNITYQLTINQGNTVNLSETACNSFTFHDSTYTETGRYVIKLTNVNGCDSTVTLLLDINTANASITQNDSLLAASIADSYQWIDCDSSLLITGATGQQYIATESGNYAVIVTTADGCTDTSECVTVTLVGNGIREMNRGTVQLYPNPTGGRVTVQADRVLNNANIRLINIVGQLLLEKTNQHGSLFTLDMSGYAAGIYFVEISEADKIMRIKVVKE